MSDTPHAATIARIDRALERIERASREQAQATRALSSRHAALRTRIGDAINALDAVIAREADAD